MGLYLGFPDDDGHPDGLADGIEYRWLSSRVDLFKGKCVFQTRTPAQGFEEADPSPLGNLTACVAQFQRKQGRNPDPEISDAVAKLETLYKRWPDKVTTAMAGKFNPQASGQKG